MQTTAPHNPDFWGRLARLAIDLDTLTRELSSLTDAEIEALWLDGPASHFFGSVDSLWDQLYDRHPDSYYKVPQAAAA